jgi:hypothetical protein
MPTMLPRHRPPIMKPLPFPFFPFRSRMFSCAVLGFAFLPLLLCADPSVPTAGCPHPDASAWSPLFASDLSDAQFPEGVWTIENGVLTASEDQCIWTDRVYHNFVLDLQFKTADGTNSGVILHASDTDNWIPNSVEIQIADDYSERWSAAAPTWQCAAMFGHQAAEASRVLPPGRWNRMTIACIGDFITVALNGAVVNEIDLSRYTSAETNPDGSAIPAWLSRPKAELPRRGHIGLQGKHAGAPIYFRALRVRELP